MLVVRSVTPNCPLGPGTATFSVHGQRVQIVVGDDGVVAVNNVDVDAESALAAFRSEHPAPGIARILAVADAVRLGLVPVEDAAVLSRQLSRTDPDDPSNWSNLPATPAVAWCLHQYSFRHETTITLTDLWSDTVEVFPADASPERAAAFLAVAAEHDPARALAHPAAPAGLAVAWADRDGYAAAACRACPTETLDYIWAQVTAELVSERPAGWRSIRERVAAHPNVSVEVAWAAAALWDWGVDRGLAENPSSDPDLLEKIAERHVNDDVQQADTTRSIVSMLARHPNTPPRVLHQIVMHTWEGIAAQVAQNPNADRLVLEAILARFTIGWAEADVEQNKGAPPSWSPAANVLVHPAADESLFRMVRGEGRTELVTGRVEYGYYPDRGVEMGVVAWWRLGVAEALGDERAGRLRFLLGCLGRGEIPVHRVHVALVES